ncbi:MAG: O-antigen ligase family protein [Bacteroidales bacterium]|jgi:O-antigen ligase|nr:O-antigen ligase family protein [Bacteroidales bacterium]
MIKERNINYILAIRILIGFLLFLQLIPPLMVFDVTSSRHFFIALFDLSAIVLCLFMGIKSKERFHFRVFGSKPFLAWLLLIAVMGFSFLQSINLIESVVVINRWIVIFICALMTVFLMEKDDKALDYIAKLSIIIAIINVIECFVPYYYLEIYKNQRNNVLLSGCYGNKNLFSAAMLFKLPFLYYAFFHFKKIWRYLAAILVFLIGVCLVILSTRTSFIGLILQLAALTSYIMYRKRKIWKNLIIVLVAVAGFACGDLFIEFNYNQFTAKHNQNQYTLSSRFESIAEGNSKGRLRIWKNTFEIIKQKPLFGYGVGNHKLAIMKVEAPQKTNWIVSDHAHNDFLEMWSELGLMGLASYVLLALTLLILSAKYAVSRHLNDRWRWMSFVALLCFLTYFNEAFFNFPSERASCQMYLALGVAFLALVIIKRRYILRKRALVWFVLALLVMIPVMYAETSHYISSVMQKERVLQSNGDSQINYTFEQWLKRMPDMPNIDENCKPVAVNIAALGIKNIARHNLDKKTQYRKAIDLLLSDNSNPYYGLREYRLSNYYFNYGLSDSAIYWANRCIEMKPLCYDPVRVLYYTYGRQKDYSAALKVVSDYILRCKRAKLQPCRNSESDMKNMLLKTAETNADKDKMNADNIKIKASIKKL